MTDLFYAVWKISEGYADKGLTPRLLITHKYFMTFEDADVHFKKQFRLIEAQLKKIEEAKNQLIKIDTQLEKVEVVKKQLKKSHDRKSSTKRKKRLSISSSPPPVEKKGKSRMDTSQIRLVRVTIDQTKTLSIYPKIKPTIEIIEK